MTRQRTFKSASAFSDLLRNIPELDSRRAGMSIQNLDYIIHRYSGLPYQAVMLVEEKMFGGALSFAQRDTHGILHQLLCRVPSARVVNARGAAVLVRYFGYHTLVFQNTSYKDGAMWWDGHPIEYPTLIQLLRFEAAPEWYGKVTP